MPKPRIFVDDLVCFDGTDDIILTNAGRKAINTEPLRLLEALQIASQYQGNKILNEATNGHGPLADRDDMSIEQFRLALKSVV